jgi:MYXO-CTERM domain-containing protein
MPMVIYHQPDDPAVTPRQHIIRSAGGPVFNALLLLVARLFRAAARPGSALREAADVAVGMNTFLSVASLNPNPSFDGGPLLKWGLVGSGRSVVQADAAVKKANQVVGVGLAGAAGVAFWRRRRLVGVLMAFVGAACLAYGFGRPSDRSGT